MRLFVWLCVTRKEKHWNLKAVETRPARRARLFVNSLSQIARAMATAR